MGSDPKLFRELCGAAGDLMQVVTEEGRFHFVNDSWLRALGYAKEEVTRLRVSDVLSTEQREVYRDVSQALAVGEVRSGLRTTLQTRSGAQLPVEGSIHRIQTDDNLVVTCAVFQDPGQHRDVALELDALFRLSLDLLCIAGTDGYFKRVNPAFECILGYSQEELLTRSFLELVHPEDRAGTLAEIENLAQGYPVVDFQNRYLAKDGRYRWLSWRSAPMAEKGLIYAVARDVTEQRRNQELIAQQTEELARSNADLERFAYVASHDLRAPLRQIAVLAEWIEEDFPGDLPPQARKHLETLHSRVQRLETMTDDLLAYARLGRQGVELSRVDTGDLVREVIALLGPDENITVSVGSELPVLTTARVPLEQVFRNLIGNAFKHRGSSQGNVVVSARDLGELVQFSVADDGPGVPRKYHEKIFEMFQKLASRDHVPGNGIGLALVKRLVELWGGRVWLDSEDGQGATFRFTWPKRLPGAGG